MPCNGVALGSQRQGMSFERQGGMVEWRTPRSVRQEVTGERQKRMVKRPDLECERQVWSMNR